LGFDYYLPGSEKNKFTCERARGEAFAASLAA
jgi:hypothetical protein